MMNEYTIMMLLDDGEEQEFNEQANNVADAIENAAYSALEMGLRPVGAVSVMNDSTDTQEFDVPNAGGEW